jgi:MoaA/NifB/PqqE/SkfB family radical SAM enzyme
LIETFRVGLLITERCNIECSHCWFESGPERMGRMTLEEASSYIDQAREIPTVEWISFTGGEPFLLPDMLKDLIGYASDRGLRTECVTNCFWAESEERALGLLQRLEGAGLDAINISADDFHQRHIPFERVKNCYSAASRLGLKTVIMCAAARSSSLRIKDVIQGLGDEGIHDIRDGKPRTPVSALAVETGFVPVGRASDIPEEEWLIGDGPVEGPCGDFLRDIGISPSGDVLPCCSAAGIVEGAILGNAKERKLTEIIEEAIDYPLFWTLSTEGPYTLAERLGLMNKGYVNRCHLCHVVLTDPRLPQILVDT